MPDRGQSALDISLATQDSSLLDFGENGSERLMSASKRAKRDHSADGSLDGQNGLLTQLFESPLGLIKRMWSTISGDSSAGPSVEVVKDRRTRANMTSGGLERQNKSFQSAETMASSTDRKNDG